MSSNFLSKNRPLYAQKQRLKIAGWNIYFDIIVTMYSIRIQNIPWNKKIKKKNAHSLGKK